MKLRILSNSIRLRLSQTEVTRLRSAAGVQSQTQFASGALFTYALQASVQLHHVDVRFGDNSLIVLVPEQQLQAWANSEQVSIRAEQKLDGAEPLKILIEKDFQCLAPREGEDESDMFAHPDAGKRC